MSMHDHNQRKNWTRVEGDWTRHKDAPAGMPPLECTHKYQWDVCMYSAQRVWSGSNRRHRTLTMQSLGSVGSFLSFLFQAPPHLTSLHLTSLCSGERKGTRLIEMPRSD